VKIRDFPQTEMTISIWESGKEIGEMPEIVCAGGPALPRKRQCYRRSPGAFTMIELIVAVLVICLLAVILLSGAQRLLPAGREAACVSNMRQLAQGVFAYAQDNGGKLPPVRDGFSDSDRSRTWMLYVCPYIGTEPYVGPDYERHRRKTVFWCPADKTEWLPPSYGGLASTYSTKNSYLANNAVMDELVQDVDGDGVIGPRSLGGISNPSKTILLMEGGRNIWNIVGHHNGAFSFFSKNRTSYLDTPENEAGYHRGASNWVFADGHIARLRLAETYGSDFNYWTADK
jgi:prepilin-type processing-associated H-X9-DG protein